MTKEGVPKFVIHQEIHNFGTLEAGEVVSFSFRYENSGLGLLKIDSVDIGCGCLQADWSKDGITTGQFDYLQVVFNSAGEWGNIYKPIVVFTNTKKKKQNIYITAKINNHLFN